MGADFAHQNFAILRQLRNLSSVIIDDFLHVIGQLSK